MTSAMLGRERCYAPPMAGTEDDDRYVANLRRELTRALARLKRAERERDAALAENARLRADLAKRHPGAEGGDRG
jgi:hypothetical protein